VSAKKKHFFPAKQSSDKYDEEMKESEPARPSVTSKKNEPFMITEVPHESVFNAGNTKTDYREVKSRKNQLAQSKSRTTHAISKLSTVPKINWNEKSKFALPRNKKFQQLGEEKIVKNTKLWYESDRHRA